MAQGGELPEYVRRAIYGEMTLAEKRATHKAEMEDPGRTARSRNIDAIRERASSLRQRR